MGLNPSPSIHRPFVEAPKHHLDGPPVKAVSVLVTDNPLDVSLMIDGATESVHLADTATLMDTSCPVAVGSKRQFTGGDTDSDPDLEARIVKVIKRVQHEQGDHLTNQEDEFFGRFVTEKLKSFPKKMRNEAKTHIFRFITDLDNAVE